MSKVTLQDSLLLCAQRIKTFTNAGLLELNEAVYAALVEMANAISTKADQTETTNALNQKADQTAMTEALNKKADQTATTNALNLKATKEEVKSALEFFASAGLYVDDDGDIAQED